MRILPLTPLLAAPAVITASAFPAGKLFCPAVKAVVTAAREQKAATAFCSSVLSVPVSTKTTTIWGGLTQSISTVQAPATTITITLPAQTTTETLAASTTTTTFTDTAYSTTSTVTVVTSTSTSTLTACNAPSPTPTVEKRAVQKSKPKPTCLASYNSKVLSSACSCLSICASTTVVTATGTPSISIVTTTVTPTSISTITLAVSTTTLPAGPVITVPETTTITTASTTTIQISTSTLVPPDPQSSPFYLQALGGPLSGRQVGFDSRPKGLTTVPYWIGAPRVNPGTFLLNADRNLVLQTSANAGHVLNVYRPTPGDAVYGEMVMSDPATRDLRTVLVNCEVVAKQDGTCPVSCSWPGGNINQLRAPSSSGFWQLTNVGSDLFVPYAVSA